ncbi:TadE/TadG family type IV pilus assembly protein [Caldalkalibacillus mannanilyticus]|uniref:TadE/TadG family type IV pilus assembly protein n=1 Tax=Caldalkalibacillus mannanilyticus TaxID=1418 RepID=UPI000468FF27|nr:TadE/TadG family type IV pilus assembly protein [Caldalkalibacillus mannanilyticus]
MGRFKKEDGSITLEAALVFPFFIFFIIFLITMIQLARVDIALENAVSESTKQISTHLYPVYTSYDWFSQTKYGKKTHEIYDKVSDTAIKADSILTEYESLFPEPIHLYTQKRDQMIGHVNEAVYSAFKPAVVAFADESIIDPERLRVTGITAPNLRTKDRLYFGIEIEYTFTFPVPFIEKDVKIKKKAMERVWIGNP